MSQSPLLKLPTELRLQILEYLLCCPSSSSTQQNQPEAQIPPTLDIRHRNGVQFHRHDKPFGTKTSWALLQINQQLRAEVSPIFFGNVIFRMRDGMTANELREWMDVIGEENIGRMGRMDWYCKGRCTMFGLQPE